MNVSTAGNSLTFQNNIDLAGGARSIVAGGNTVYLNGAISDSVGGGFVDQVRAGRALHRRLFAEHLFGHDHALRRQRLSEQVVGLRLCDSRRPGAHRDHADVGDLAGRQPDCADVALDLERHGGWQEIQLCGHNQTTAGLYDYTSQAAMENTWGGSGYGSVTLTVNTAAGTSYSL